MGESSDKHSIGYTIGIMNDGIDDGDGAIIKNIEGLASNANATIYDLQGRAVNNPVHGIYIKNGKKFVY